MLIHINKYLNISHDIEMAMKKYLVDVVLLNHANGATFSGGAFVPTMFFSDRMPGQWFDSEEDLIDTDIALCFVNGDIEDEYEVKQYVKEFCYTAFASDGMNVSEFKIPKKRLVERLKRHTSIAP